MWSSNIEQQGSPFRNQEVAQVVKLKHAGISHAISVELVTAAMSASISSQRRFRRELGRRRIQ
jgi:hypothetical protein